MRAWAPLQSQKAGRRQGLCTRPQLQAHVHRHPPSPHCVSPPRVHWTRRGLPKKTHPQSFRPQHHRCCCCPQGLQAAGTNQHWRRRKIPRQEREQGPGGHPRPRPHPHLARTLQRAGSALGATRRRRAVEQRQQRGTGTERECHCLRALEYAAPSGRWAVEPHHQRCCWSRHLCCPSERPGPPERPTHDLRNGGPALAGQGVPQAPPPRAPHWHWSPGPRPPPVQTPASSPPASS